MSQTLLLPSTTRHPDILLLATLTNLGTLEFLGSTRVSAFYILRFNLPRETGSSHRHHELAPRAAQIRPEQRHQHRQHGDSQERRRDRFA